MRDIIGDFLQRPWRSVTCLLRERLGTNQRLGLCSFRGYGGHLFPCSPSSLLGAGRHEWYRRIETPVAGNWGRDAELTGFGGDLFVSKRSILASLAQQRGPSPPFKSGCSPAIEALAVVFPPDSNRTRSRPLQG